MKRMSLHGALYLFVPLSVLVMGCASPSAPNEDHHVRWRLIYEQAADGSAMRGSKAELIETIRTGARVRVYWKGRRVEHLVDAGFLTVMGGEVFAQPSRIVGQRPSAEGEPPSIQLAADGSTWTTIVSTNGEFRRSARWFVDQP